MWNLDEFEIIHKIYALLLKVVCAAILPRDFIQTQGNYSLSLTTAKIRRYKNFKLKKFGQFLKALTMKFLISKNKRTFHPEILIKFTDSKLYGYRTTSNEKIKISLKFHLL